jgi:hypothetical protein
VPPRVSRYELGSTEGSGAEYVVNVRYFMRDEEFVVRSRWRKENGGWMVAHAERLWSEGEKRPGTLSKIAGSIVRAIAGLRR